MNSEEIIIGGIVAGHILPSATGLDPADFAKEELAEAFRAAIECEREQVAIDAELLHRRTLTSDLCWYSAESYRQMAKTAASRSVVFDAVNRVKRDALTAFLKQQAQSYSETDLTGAKLLDAWRQTLDRAEKFYATAENSFQFMHEIAPRVQAVYDDLYRGISYAIPTGMTQTDQLLGDGYSKGDLHVIVGMTGHGKSSVALNHALNQASAGYTVGIVSREMSDIENVMRLQSARSGIPRWRLRKDMFATDHQGISENLKEMASLPIAFDTRTDDVETLAFNVRQMVDKYDLAILYVDYLQLLSSKTAGDTRANEVQSISRNLKTLAMDCQIPVVALCQFNNGVINASLFDVMNFIRESGSIKQDASTIAYIQVEHSEERKDVKDAKYTVLKNRNGEAFASVELRFEGALFRFTEI
jgi:replicative DNA helicase